MIALMNIYFMNLAFDLILIILNLASTRSTCEEERLRASEMDRADPEGHIFIPDCDTNGLFKRAQCHNSTGYCWCVDEKTGVPIPGISTHNITPDCTDVKTKRLKGQK